MFIVVYFGYKQHRIFTIDCLSASLIDAIIHNSLKDIHKLLLDKEEEHKKEIVNIGKQNMKLEKRVEELVLKIKEKEE